MFSSHAVQTVVEVQVVHAVIAAQEHELKKYVESNVVHVLASVHVAQLRGQQAPLTTV